MKKPTNFKNLSLEGLAAVVSEKLREHGIDAILVGGACVSIYSHNRYESYDLDYVTYENLKKVAKALGELDFLKRDRYFSHPESEFFIEFVSPPVAIGKEPIHVFQEHKTPLGTIKMLTPTDSVKDRLASFYHWDDKQGLEQAITICCTDLKKIDIDAIKKWSKEEGYLNKFKIFLEHLRRNSNQKF